MDEVRLTRLLDQVRQEGGRMTKARRALLRSLVDANGHLTADDLAAMVQVRHPDVHRSTIYRSLDALEHLGLVDHVHLGHGRAVYHLSDDDHQHLVCDNCGSVAEVPESLFVPLGRALLREYGFSVRSKHFAVLGRCSKCSSKS